MMRTNGYSKALFGGLLWGEKPVRFVFVDEAGTSTHEPVTVVVAIVADADSHVMSAEALVKETLGAVPSQHKENFVFHATAVFNDRKYQNGWSMTDRLKLLKNMMKVPRRIGMAVAVSAVWRNSAGSSVVDPRVMSQSQFDHYKAFTSCMGVVDRNIRENAGLSEVATVVAEDVPEMRRFLKSVPQNLRDYPMHVSPEHMRRTPSDKAAGYSIQSGEMRVTRIRNSVHFVEKSEDPLVQVADACAYGFRRYFAGEQFGSDFADAIIGSHLLLKDFGSPESVGCWWTLPALP
jgi:hypothetical protein